MEKKLYTILGANNEVLYGRFFIEGEQPENATDKLVTELWAKPVFDQVTQTFTNVATPEEQAEFEAKFNTDTTEQ